MDDIKKLAERLHNHHPSDKPKKSSKTMNVTHHTYMLLFAYCQRKKLNIGDVMSDLMKMLVDELHTNGELTTEDQTLADEYERVKQEREDASNKFKKTDNPDSAA